MGISSVLFKLSNLLESGRCYLHALEIQGFELPPVYLPSAALAAFGLFSGDPSSISSSLVRDLLIRALDEARSRNREALGDEIEAALGQMPAS